MFLLCRLIRDRWFRYHECTNASVEFLFAFYLSISFSHIKWMWLNCEKTVSVAFLAQFISGRNFFLSVYIVLLWLNIILYVWLGSSFLRHFPVLIIPNRCNKIWSVDRCEVEYDAMPIRYDAVVWSDCSMNGYEDAPQNNNNYCALHMLSNRFHAIFPLVCSLKPFSCYRHFHKSIPFSNRLLSSHFIGNAHVLPMCASFAAFFTISSFYSLAFYRQMFVWCCCHRRRRHCRFFFAFLPFRAIETASTNYKPVKRWMCFKTWNMH